MGDIELAINRAWQRIVHDLIADPHALAARLARRRRPTLTCPPRAWCLALRASDRRLVTDDPHTVTITSALCEQLCAPVQLPAPGVMVDEAAELLGTTPVGLRNARIAGTVRTRHIAHLAGRRGKPVPTVYIDHPLDPCAKRLASPDPGWMWTAGSLCRRVPRNLFQIIERVPHYLPHVGRHVYSEHRHPELDGASPPRKSLRLPPPEPDNVWYKWSRTGNYFLGDDPTNWRKSPDDFGDRPPRWLVKKKQKRRPRPSRSSGSLHFNGHLWRCPACARTCRTIYLPLAPINLLAGMPDLPPIAKVIDILPPRVAGFACHRCHRVRFFTRVRIGEAWNQLIAYLTAGLLYGREVPRPETFTTKRLKPLKPRPGAPPANRRALVRDHLLAGDSLATIATAMHITKNAVVAHANRIYKSERVRGQRALMLQHAKPLPPHLTLRADRILTALRAGDSPARIARALNIRLASVERYQRDLRRTGKLPPRPTKRDQVAALHAAGLNRHEIAARLGMTPQSVYVRLCELRAAGSVAPARGAPTRHA